MIDLTRLPLSPHMQHVLQRYRKCTVCAGMMDEVCAGIAVGEYGAILGQPNAGLIDSLFSFHMACSRQCIARVLAMPVLERRLTLPFMVDPDIVRLIFPPW